MEFVCRLHWGRSAVGSAPVVHRRQSHSLTPDGKMLLAMRLTGPALVVGPVDFLRDGLIRVSDDTFGLDKLYSRANVWSVQAGVSGINLKAFTENFEASFWTS